MPSSVQPQDRKTKSKTSKKSKGRRGAALTPTSASQWRKATGLHDLPLPSGNVCRVRRPGLDAMIADGLLADSLMSIITAAIDNGKGKSRPKVKSIDDADLVAIMSDRDKWTAMMDSTDRAVAYVVVEPKCLYHKRERTRPMGEDGKLVGEVIWDVIPEEDRDPDAIYTDDVDIEDKMFIFNFACGASSELERFRPEHAGRVAELLDGAEVPHDAESAPESD